MTMRSRIEILQRAHGTTIRFADPAKASAFETSLKSGSGRAFAARHS